MWAHPVIRNCVPLFYTSNGALINTYVNTVLSFIYAKKTLEFCFIIRLTAFAKSKLNCESRVVFPAPVGPVKTTNSPPLNPLQILTSYRQNIVHVEMFGVRERGG